MKINILLFVTFFLSLPVMGQTVLLPDSAVLKKLDGSIFDKQAFEYYANGNKKQESFYTRNNKTPVWKKRLKNEYEWDKNGNQTMEVSYSGLIWRKQAETRSLEINYDDNLPDNWEGITKHLSEYDSNGNETLSVIYGWEEEINQWKPNYKCESQYDSDGNKVSDISYFGDDEDWFQYAACNYKYGYDASDNRIFSIKNNIYPDDDDFFEVPSEKYEYKYDANNNLISSVFYSWDDDTSKWHKKYRFEYEYDSNGNQILETFYSQIEEKDLEKYYQYGHTYNDEGKLMEMSCYQWDKKIQNWAGKYKYEYTYDADGNLASVNDYDWNENDWFVSKTGLYYYSGQSMNIENLSGEISVKVYPNPTTDYIIIAGAEGLNAVIVDTQGRIVCTKKNIGTTETIQTSTWKSGVYFVTLQAGSNRITKKIIKK
jgi:hypothetical protein